MARREHFGPQLAMFIPAGAFAESARAGRLVFGDDAGEGTESLRAEKVQEAKVGPASATHGRIAKQGKMTLYKSIERHGVRDPVIIDNEDDVIPELAEGHHRVFAAADIDPTMEVPVVHGGWVGGEFYDYSIGQKGGRKP